MIAAVLYRHRPQHRSQWSACAAQLGEIDSRPQATPDQPWSFLCAPIAATRRARHRRSRQHAVLSAVTQPERLFWARRNGGCDSSSDAACTARCCHCESGHWPAGLDVVDFQRRRAQLIRRAPVGTNLQRGWTWRDPSTRHRPAGGKKARIARAKTTRARRRRSVLGSMR